MKRNPKSTKWKVTGMAMGALLLLSLGLLRVYTRHQVIRVGYELRQVQTELRALEEEKRELLLEESVLTNPDRIESIAKSLGMVRPAPEQLRVVKSSGAYSIHNSTSRALAMTK